MIDLIKKTLLAGVGAVVITKEKIEATLEDSVRQGKVSAADARIMAEKIADQSRQEFDQLTADLTERFQHALDRKDKDAAARLTALETRVALLEQKLAEAPTRNGEP